MKGVWINVPMAPIGCCQELTWHGPPTWHPNIGPCGPFRLTWHLLLFPRAATSPRKFAFLLFSLCFRLHTIYTVIKKKSACQSSSSSLSVCLSSLAMAIASSIPPNPWNYELLNFPHRRDALLLSLSPRFPFLASSLCTLSPFRPLKPTFAGEFSCRFELFAGNSFPFPPDLYPQETLFFQKGRVSMAFDVSPRSQIINEGQFV